MTKRENQTRKNAILERVRARREMEEQCKKASKEAKEFRLWIFSRLSQRIMTGEEAYNIIKTLEETSLEELRKIKEDLLKAEEQLRGQILEAKCKSGNVSKQKQLTIKEKLAPLNLSELEVVAKSIRPEENELLSKNFGGYQVVNSMIIKMVRERKAAKEII